MPAKSISTFTLLDGTEIPWLGWGNGSGKSRKEPLESGKLALAAGIRHIDTAQIYGTEEQTGQVVTASGIDRSEIYITTKLSQHNGKAVPLDQVRPAIEESIRKIGFTPDLLLIHNPFVSDSRSDLQETWRILEALKSEGKLKSLGVSNFRLQDLTAILEIATVKPVVNQLEYHPFLLTHLAPVLALQAKHGIRTESYGPLTPLLRHPASGGPLIPILTRISERLTKALGKPIDNSQALLLWTRAQGVIAITTSTNPERIKGLAEVAALPDGLLEEAEIKEINELGEKIHFRHYVSGLGLCVACARFAQWRLSKLYCGMYDLAAEYGLDV